MNEQETANHLISKYENMLLVNGKHLAYHDAIEIAIKDAESTKKHLKTYFLGYTSEVSQQFLDRVIDELDRLR